MLKSKITEKYIKLVSPTVDEYVKTMQKAGAREEMIGMSVGFARAIQQGEFDALCPILLYSNK